MKVGRNDPCPCGSGKKYKHCCYAKDSVKKDEPVVEARSEAGESEEDSETGGKEGRHSHEDGRRGFHGGAGGKGQRAFNPRTFRGSQRGN